MRVEGCGLRVEGSGVRVEGKHQVRHCAGVARLGYEGTVMLKSQDICRNKPVFLQTAFHRVHGASADGLRNDPSGNCSTRSATVPGCAIRLRRKNVLWSAYCRVPGIITHGFGELQHQVCNCAGVRG